MSIKVHLIKNILITESNQRLTANMRLTTREYGMWGVDMTYPQSKQYGNETLLTCAGDSIPLEPIQA